MNGAHQTRDQQRALHAYASVRRLLDARVDKKEQDGYRGHVNDLGAQIVRSGLAAAMAWLERGKAGAGRLLEDLAGAGIPGLANLQPNQLPDRVRNLGLSEYMLASRETLRVAHWLKRAAQARLHGDTGRRA